MKRRMTQQQREILIKAFRILQVASQEGERVLCSADADLVDLDLVRNQTQTMWKGAMEIEQAIDMLQGSEALLGKIGELHKKVKPGTKNPVGRPRTKLRLVK